MAEASRQEWLAERKDRERTQHQEGKHTPGETKSKTKEK